MLPNFLPGLHTFKYIKHNQFSNKASYKVQCTYALTFQERQKKRLLCKSCFSSPIQIITAYNIYFASISKFLKTSHLLSRALGLNLPTILWGWGEASEPIC